MTGGFWRKINNGSAGLVYSAPVREIEHYSISADSRIAGNGDPTGAIDNVSSRAKDHRIPAARARDRDGSIRSWTNGIGVVGVIYAGTREVTVPINRN